MIDFDKYKELYQCDFSKSITDASAMTYSQSQGWQREQEHQLQRLFEFIKLWKDRYELFCDNFDTYSYTEQSMPLWSRDKSERGYIPLPKSEFYIDEFFNMILNKRAKFETQKYGRGMHYDKSRSLIEQTNENILILGNKFTAIGKDDAYRLYIKINSALICSLIGAISNNHTVYNWYSKKSRFKEFIDKMTNSHCFVEFNGYNRIYVSGSQSEPSLFIDVDGKYLYFALPNEIVRVENRLHYNHLDSLFGKDRTKPLTQEDLQLYSIVNEGRKPLMYDFEF